MCVMNYSMMVQQPSPTIKQRKDLTLALAFTSVTILLLAFLDNLRLPPTDSFDDLVEWSASAIPGAQSGHVRTGGEGCKA